MVISNQLRQHPGSMDGNIFEERKGQRPPGKMFFNEKGDKTLQYLSRGNSHKRVLKTRYLIRADPFGLLKV